MKEENMIPIDDPMKNFTDHIHNNERIVFSARFGDGKTFFINKFMEKQKGYYLFITIYPTNYQVEDNKDIFELIKRDILYQLCEKGFINDQIDVNSIITSTFDKETICELISFLESIANISNIPGSNLIFKLVNKFIDAKEKYDKNKKTYSNYINKFAQIPGIYEHDCYTQLITAIIQSYQKEKKNKAVLIIEDLDRIDPAHVFRILNIFSAHIDRHYNNPDQKYPNKFAFDIVILVCCYESLQNIFHHIYGEKADFKGYIQKFITQNIFNYSLNDVKCQFLFNKISEISKIDETILRGINEINNKVKNLSIREITTIITNLDKQIKNVQTNVFSDYKANILGPLSRFLAILKNLNLNKDEYDGILNMLALTYPNELKDTIGPLWGIPVKELAGKDIYLLTNKYKKETLKISIAPILDLTKAQSSKDEITINEVNITIKKLEQEEEPGKWSQNFIHKIFVEVERYIL